MAGMIAGSVALFWLCWRFDNKYTADGPQAANGLLTLDGKTLEAYPLTFLTQGWEIYRGRLLEPEDFQQSGKPDEIVWIGQYGGFEGSNPDGSPYGCATYRMNILIPPEPAAYMLELPEIYSAYKLYINGVLAEQFGDPDPANYRPHTGNALVSFLAQNRIEIILAVSDYSHLYGGMVYPPAFGIPQAVSAMIQARLTVRTAVCSVALALGLLFIGVGVFMHKNRPMLLFGLLCFCFAGYTCYPVVKTIFRGGMAWYALENFCFCVMLLLVGLLLKTISVDNGKFSRAFPIFGAVVCFCSLLRAFLPAGDLHIVTAYSMLIGLYKWAAAFFLTVGTLRMAGRQVRYGYTILTGILVFDCALVMDRLLPLYEPVIAGWFLETAGFAIVAALGAVMGREILRQYRDKLALEGKIIGIQHLVEMQRDYYPVILKSVEEARHARHDLRHHLSAIQGLASIGQYDELKAYLNQYVVGFSDLTPLTYCENYVADVILRHFAALAAQEGMRFEVNAAIPEALFIEDADLCMVVGNLLENALEACLYIAENQYISITIKQIHSELVILVDNSFDGNIRTQGGTFLSRKRPNREGVGLASVRSVAEKYGGAAKFMLDQNVFRSEVTLKLNE